MERDSNGRFDGGTNEYRRSHGMSTTKIYKRWRTMLSRCENPNCNTYQKYGAKGVTVCERWHKFENFYEDMGEPPFEGATLERVDGTIGYTPENVIWADYTTQNRNRTWAT